MATNLQQSEPATAASSVGYAVKEIYYSIHGEGFHAGRPSVMCRFTGCNLWSGLERDRATAVCNFCDTEFVGTDGPGGGRFADAGALAEAVLAQWPAEIDAPPRVVCTGGEPLLQLDEPLVSALRRAGLEVAVETNGTLPAPAGIDWLCVSPKAGAACVQRAGDELKVVYPQVGLDPAAMEDWDFCHYFLQPKDGVEYASSLQQVVGYCLDHPKWRVSIQLHKVLGVP